MRCHLECSYETRKVGDLCRDKRYGDPVFCMVSELLKPFVPKTVYNKCKVHP